MKKLITHLLTIACAALTGAAWADLNYTWRTVADSQESANYNPNGIVYASNQIGVAAQVKFSESGLNNATIFKFDGDNSFYLQTTAEGKYYLKIANGQTVKFEETSETSATTGYHRFSALFRRGVRGGGGHIISAIVYLDGATLFQVGNGSTACGTGPLRQVTFGGTAGNIVSGSIWSAVAACGTADEDAGTMAKIEEDAVALYPNVIELNEVLAESSSVSALKQMIADRSATIATFTVSSAITLTVDEALAFDIPVKFQGEGSVTLQLQDGVAAPTADAIALFDGVTGNLVRPYLPKPKVIAINFNATAKDNNENDGEDTVKLGDAEDPRLADFDIPGAAWTQLTEKTMNEAQEFMVYDLTAGAAVTGLETAPKATWSSNNHYMYRSSTSKILKGYLDDGGTHAQLTMSDIPFKAYDVIIVCAADTENRKFNPVTVNGKMYKWDTTRGATVETATATTDDIWGQTRGNYPVYGRNTLRISKQTGKLSITGGGNVNSARGGIAAVVIVESSAEVIDKSDIASVSAANAIEGIAEAEIVNLRFDDGATFTLDAEPANTFNLFCAGTINLVATEDFDSAGLAKLVLREGATAQLSSDLTVDADDFPIFTMPLEIAERKTLTFSGEMAMAVNGALSGAGAVAVAMSDGVTLTFGSANTFKGGLMVASGTAKAVNRGFGYYVNNLATDELSTITVSAGATLDLANQNSACYKITTAGTVTNSGNDIGNGSAQTTTMTLTGNAVVSGNTFGLLGWGYGATALDLGAHTLTVKMAAGKRFLLDKTTVSGTGKIVVESGHLWTVRDASTAADVTVEVKENASLLAEAALVVKAVSNAGSTTVGQNVTTDTLVNTGTMTGGYTLIVKNALTGGTSGLVRVRLGTDCAVTLNDGEAITATDAFEHLTAEGGSDANLQFTLDLTGCTTETQKAVVTGQQALRFADRLTNITLTQASQDAGWRLQGVNNILYALKGEETIVGDFVVGLDGSESMTLRMAADPIVLKDFFAANHLTVALGGSGIGNTPVPGVLVVDKPIAEDATSVTAQAQSCDDGYLKVVNLTFSLTADKTELVVTRNGARYVTAANGTYGVKLQSGTNHNYGIRNLTIVPISVAQDYDGVSNTMEATNWFTDWAGEKFDLNTSMKGPIAGENVVKVAEGKHPYHDSYTLPAANFTLAVYANGKDLVNNEGEAKNLLLFAIGGKDNDGIRVVKAPNGNLQMQVVKHGTFVTDNGDGTATTNSVQTTVVETSINWSKYHLIAVTGENKCYRLLVDGEYIGGGFVNTTLSLGVQIGSVVFGLPTDSADYTYRQGYNLGVKRVLGYNMALDAEQLMMLGETYPAKGIFTPFVFIVK